MLDLRLPIFTRAALIVALGAAAGCGSDPGPGGTTTGGNGGTGGTGGNGGGGGPVFPEEHPRIYLNAGNRARLGDALAEGRPSATRFRDMVDGELAGTDYYAFSATFAALMYQLSDEATYCDFAVKMVDDFVASEEQLIADGEAASVAGDSYLYVGEHVGDLAITYDWCFDHISDAQKKRWLPYAHQAIWNVWHPEEATWGGMVHTWTGWSIDNPFNNYYYSFLRATMLFGLAARGEHPDADGWITMFRDTKIQSQLVPTFLADLEGGGSREGTGYGVSHMKLFELYDLWQASTGEDISTLTPHARASLLSFLHLTVPTLDRIAPIGDHARDSTAELFDYHRNYVQILTYLFRSDPLAKQGKWFLGHSALPEMSQPFMYVYDFLYEDPSVTEAPLTALYPAYHAPGTGEIFARSSWDTSATWLNFIAGPYTESHAHHDQGSFLIYKNEWLAYDENIASHSGIHQEEEVHNLVRFAQSGQTVQMRESGPETKLLALDDSPSYFYVAADVTPVYDGDPAVLRAERELVFLKPNCVVVFDRAESSGADRVWQLNTPLLPVISGARTTIAGPKSTLTLDRVLPAGATTTVLDWTSDPEMSMGHRLDVVHAGNGGVSRFLHVLSLDGSVATVAANDSGPMRGARIDFADGTWAIVRFGDDTPGGELERHDAGDNLIEEATLAPGVAKLPELATP